MFLSLFLFHPWPVLQEQGIIVKDTSKHAHKVKIYLCIILDYRPHCVAWYSYTTVVYQLQLHIYIHIHGIICTFIFVYACVYSYVYNSEVEVGQEVHADYNEVVTKHRPFRQQVSRKTS